MATLASMVEIPEGMKAVHIVIEQRDTPAFCSAIESKEGKVVDSSTWYYNIWRVLKNGKYPEGVDKKTSSSLEESRPIHRLCETII